MSDKETKKENKKIAELEKTVEDLQKQLDAMTAEKQSVFEQLQRVSADYANFQKRAPKQIADSVAYEKKTILRSLLPSIDNFEKALCHASNTQGEEAMATLLKGIRMTFDHMLDALKAQGVKRMEAMGQPFDPTLHEAMMRRAEPDKPNNTVLEVYQTGYLMGEQVLRPSKVIVNRIEEEKLPAPQAPEDEPETTDTEPEV